MGVYKIFDRGEEINRIVASEAFVAEWCPANGYTYEREAMPLPIPEPDQEPQYTEIQLLAQQVTDLELLVLGGKSDV